MSEHDVAIIGAGFAGLAAARVLAHLGVHAEIYEATERVGGRAHTLYDDVSGAPIELGPEYIHGEPEPTLALMRAAGLARESFADHHHLWRHGELQRVRGMWERFGQLLAGADDLPRDESARAYMERERMHGEDAALFAMLVEGFYAAPLEDVGIRGIASDAGGAGGDEAAAQTRPAKGYGALVGWLYDELVRRGVHFHLGHVVEAIRWDGELVRIELRHHEAREIVAARRVIVTLPLGVLQAGSVRFAPALPDDVQRALGQLGMGQVVKLVLCMREPVWRSYAPADLEFVHRRDAAFPTFWLRGERQITAWAGGPHAIALRGASPAQLAGRAIETFAELTGTPTSVMAAAVAHHHMHDHAIDPFARGAYSYTRAGGLGAADVLATPLGDRMFLAGEATDTDYEGSVAGAITSGERAAQQVLRSLGRLIA